MTRIVRTAYRYKRPPLMALGLCAMIVVTATALGADSTFDGVYIGKRVLTKGSDQTCPDAGTVSVTLRGEALTFTNSRLHSISISFKPQPNGSFSQISAGGGCSATIWMERASIKMDSATTLDGMIVAVD